MNKKIRTTDTGIVISSTKHLVVDINNTRFIFDEEMPHWITVNSYEEDGKYINFDEIDNDECSLTQEDLKRIALNWYFDNVEIVSDKKMYEYITNLALESGEDDYEESIES